MVRTLCLVFASVFFPLAANAGQLANGLIGQVAINASGGASVSFSLSNVTGTRPACAVNSAGLFAFDATTLAGQSMVRMLTAAKISGATVIVNGDSTCNYNGSYENIGTLYIAGS